MRSPPRWSWAALGALLLAAPRASAAEPDMRACVSAYEEGQRLLRRSELRLAREQLLLCARAPCPREMWPDCLRWMDEVEKKMPSIVLAARDSEGRDVTDVRVTMDGKPLGDQLGSQAIEVDPGEHRFVLRWKNHDVEQVVLVREGEKSRLVTVQLEPRESPPPARERVEPARESHTPVAAYVAGGIGLVALGAFAVLGLSGRADYMDLKSSCAPRCSSSDTSPVQTKLIAADISLGVSVAAFALATYLFLKTPHVQF